MLTDYIYCSTNSTFYNTHGRIFQFLVKNISNIPRTDSFN